jgi:IS1 transposase
MNQPLLNALHPDEVDVVIQRVEEAEVDEMWSYVGKKREPRWLWHAIDHRSGQVLAYVLGRRKYEVLYGLLGRLHASSRCGCAPTRQAQHAANRAQAPNVTHPDQTPDAQDDLLFPIDPDA